MRAVSGTSVPRRRGGGKRCGAGRGVEQKRSRRGGRGHPDEVGGGFAEPAVQAGDGGFGACPVGGARGQCMAAESLGSDDLRRLDALA